MSSGFIRIIGEKFPKPIIPLSDEKKPLRKQLVFVQNAAKINPIEPIDYKIVIKIGDRKRQLIYYSGQIFREAQTRFKRLVEIARKERTNTIIQFWANDFLFEKYDHE